MERKINVNAAIKALEIDEMAHFPLSRYDYIVSCKGRIQTATKKRFSSHKNSELGRVEITRTA